MTNNKGFEQIIAWQKARALNKFIYEITSKPKFIKDFALQHQIRKASISISSNIAEGYGRKSNKEFIQFLSIAKASCFELKSQLYLTHDVKYITDDEFKESYDLAEEVSKTIHGFIKHIENKQDSRSQISEVRQQNSDNREENGMLTNQITDF
jgi:four helix bundle protein